MTFMLIRTQKNSAAFKKNMVTRHFLQHITEQNFFYTINYTYMLVSAFLKFNTKLLMMVISGWGTIFLLYTFLY